MDINITKLNKFFIRKFHDEVDWQESNKTESHIVDRDVFAYK